MSVNLLSFLPTLIQFVSIFVLHSHPHSMLLCFYPPQFSLLAKLHVSAPLLIMHSDSLIPLCRKPIALYQTLPNPLEQLLSKHSRHRIPNHPAQNRLRSLRELMIDGKPLQQGEFLHVEGALAAGVDVRVAAASGYEAAEG